jgi:hypothetical protein
MGAIVLDDASSGGQLVMHPPALVHATLVALSAVK